MNATKNEIDAATDQRMEIAQELQNRKEIGAMKMRPFDKHDWDAFAGAEGWSDAAPFFAEGRFQDGVEYVLVLASNGGYLVADDEQSQFGGYSLMRQFATPADAQAFAERLGEPKTKGDFFLAGFRENGEFAD